MLDRDALAQLRGLKNQIESEKERTEGVVRGTGSRFGFVRLDDGREVFLPPEEMLKVFPGDRVRVCVQPGKDKRLVADIEGLVESCVGTFTGRCVSKGPAMFVEPDLPEINRWLFLPPQARAGAQSGDYLRCELLKHPVRDGKPQAKVIQRIGSPDEAGIENRFTMAKHGLEADWPAAELEQLNMVLAANDPASDASREDFTDLAFVTIDAARTQDIDDALYAEVTSDGWTLYIAIADPTAYIDAESPLRATVRERASSVYFHGSVVPMLPECIAQQRCALVENEQRPALVCRVAVSEDGVVGDFRFFEARIRSRAKLSYYAVDRYLSGQDQALICHSTPLEALYGVSRALRARREAQELVMEDRQEFRWSLNDRGHIESIERCEKLLSQRLVEECMVAANRCAARFLEQSEASGPFVVHDGFRRDRQKDRDRFMAAYLPGDDAPDPDSLEGYRDLLKQLATSEHELPLRSMVNRLLTRARLSKKPGAHMGMSLPAYTNCTSPLRKYLDFLVHLQIKSALRGAPATHCQQPELDAITARLGVLRKISLEAERWLALEYLQRLARESSNPWSGVVSYIANNGITVRLDANGLEGFVELPVAERKAKNKGQGKRRNKSAAAEQFSFDKLSATLQSKTRQFRVETPVKVTLCGVAADPAHQPLFKLTPESGRKPAGLEPAPHKPTAQTPCGDDVVRADAGADTDSDTGAGKNAGDGEHETSS